MKVCSQDDRLLQLRPQGGWILLLIGITMALSAILSIWFLGQSTTFSCERIASGHPQCNLSRTVLGLPVSNQSLDTLTGAYVAESTDSDGDTMYRVMLEADGTRVPFTQHTSSPYSPKADAVAEIERYLRDTSITTLTLQDSGTVGLAVSGVLILAGIGLGVAGAQALSTLWTFDRDRDAVVKYRRSLFGSKMWEYTLSDITSVIVGSSRDSDGDRTYRVEMYTSEGQRIPMTSWYSSGYQGKQRTVEIISAFINQT